MEKLTCCEKVDRLQNQIEQNEKAISQLISIVSSLNQRIKSLIQAENKFLI